MKKKTKVNKLLFAGDPEFLDIPRPARNYIPDWYVNIDRHLNNKPQSTLEQTSKSVKTCVPFLDSMTSGYTIELWTDIQIHQTPDGPMIIPAAWPNPTTMRHAPQNETIPVPMGCGPHHLTWLVPFHFQTPPGYSLMFQHPHNRFDLPFVSLSGVVDADAEGGITKGNFPFFLKEGFEGIIPVGTPLLQVTPFRRERWLAEKDVSILDNNDRLFFLASRLINGGFYKSRAWKKKYYD